MAIPRITMTGATSPVELMTTHFGSAATTRLQQIATGCTSRQRAPLGRKLSRCTRQNWKGYGRVIGIPNGPYAFSPVFYGAVRAASGPQTSGGTSKIDWPYGRTGSNMPSYRTSLPRPSPMLAAARFERMMRWRPDHTTPR